MNSVSGPYWGAGLATRASVLERAIRDRGSSVRDRSHALLASAAVPRSFRRSIMRKNIYRAPVQKRDFRFRHPQVRCTSAIGEGQGMRYVSLIDFNALRTV